MYDYMFGRLYHRSYSRLQGQRKPLSDPIIRLLFAMAACGVEVVARDIIP